MGEELQKVCDAAEGMVSRFCELTVAFVRVEETLETLKKIAEDIVELGRRAE